MQMTAINLPSTHHSPAYVVSPAPARRNSNSGAYSMLSQSQESTSSMTAIPTILPSNRRRTAAVRLWPGMVAAASAAAAATLLGAALTALPAFAQQQSRQQQRPRTGQPGRLPDGRPIGPDSTRPGPPSSRRPGAAGDPAGTRRSPTTPDNSVGAGRTVPQVPPGDASRRIGLTPATSGAGTRSTDSRSGVRTSTSREQQQRRQRVNQRRRSGSVNRRQAGQASQRRGRNTGRNTLRRSRPR
jgi:hypothetical protein